MELKPYKVVCDYLQHEDRVYPKGEIVELSEPVAAYHLKAAAVCELGERTPLATATQDHSNVRVAASRIPAKNAKPKR